MLLWKLARQRHLYHRSGASGILNFASLNIFAASRRCRRLAACQHDCSVKDKPKRAVMGALLFPPACGGVRMQCIVR